MKNLILAAVSASALFALSACGGDAAEEAPDTTVIETETVEPAPMATETTAMDPAAGAAADAAADSADMAADAAVDSADAAADAAGDAADAAAE